MKQHNAHESAVEVDTSPEALNTSEPVPTERAVQMRRDTGVTGDHLLAHLEQPRGVVQLKEEEGGEVWEGPPLLKRVAKGGAAALPEPRWLNADLEGDAHIMMLDDEVQQAVSYLIREWLGESNPAPLFRDSAEQPFMPLWGGRFRAQALELHPDLPDLARRQGWAKAGRALADRYSEANAAQRYRQAVMERSDERAESQDNIIDKAAWKKKNDDNGYTSCMDFVSQTTGDAALNMNKAGATSDNGDPIVTAVRINATQYDVFGGAVAPPAGSYQPIGVGEAQRPRPGDILALAKADGDSFAHVSFMKTILPAPDDEELWVTNDGGPPDAEQRQTYYEPATCKLWFQARSERTEKTAPRYHLKGWFDLEKLYSAEQQRVTAFKNAYMQRLSSKPPGQGLKGTEHAELRNQLGLTNGEYRGLMETLKVPAVNPG